MRSCDDRASHRASQHKSNAGDGRPERREAISNIGNATLNISYLEGDWKTVQIPSGQYVTIPSQSTGLSVSFNDGVETKSLVLNRGTMYALHWNAELNRWAILPYDEVADVRPASAHVSRLDARQRHAFGVPPCGEGLGVGVVRLTHQRCQTAPPPPQPSPTRGEGADRACGSL